MLIPRRLLTACFSLAAVLLAGCAIHAPMSESVMFRHRTTQPAHTQTIGLGFAFGYAPAYQTARELALKRYPEQDYSVEDLIDNNDVSLGIYTAFYDAKGRAGFSFTLGANAGADLTVQLWRRNYLTAAVSVPSQWQFFLQHRAYNSSHVAAVLGAGYQRRAFGFCPPSEGLTFCPSDIEHVGSWGIRATGLVRTGGESHSAGLKVGTYVGYMPGLARSTVGLTLTLGHF